MESVDQRQQSGADVKILLEQCHLVACPLAAPWVYRRKAIYYLRIRPSGVSKQAFTLSLRTRHREKAMRHTRRIQAALTAFHLDRPDDHWEDLVVPLREKAEQTLLDSIRWEEREAQAVAYSELLEDLGFIRATEPMTADHVKALGMSIKIVQGGLERLLKGNPDPLREVVEELREAEAQLSVPKPTVTPEAPVATNSDYMPLSRLASLYMAEQEGNYAEKSVKDMNSSFKVLAEALTDENGVELDMKTHTREDMVSLKKKLLASGRKPLTVNKLLTRLSTLTTWAQNNRYLDNAFNKGLKITKGAESGRKAFSDEQVRLIMSEMARLPKDNWKRWAMSLGVITGARIGEIFQLTKSDVSTIGGITVIDFNDDGDKTLKNSNSRRLVPLVDGAYGFDLKAFLEYVEGCEDKLFDRVSHNFTRVLNETLRDICHHDSGEGLTFHSLRHSLASLMKHRGVQVSVAQDILGHRSQTITFDLYGGDARLDLSKLVEALKESFGV